MDNEDSKLKPQIRFIGGSGKDLQYGNDKYCISGRPNPSTPSCGFDKFVQSNKDLQNKKFEEYVQTQQETNTAKDLLQDIWFEDLLDKKPLGQQDPKTYVTDEIVHDTLKFLYGSLDKNSLQYQSMCEEVKLSLQEELEEYLKTNVAELSDPTDTAFSINSAPVKNSVAYEDLDEIDDIDFLGSNNSDDVQVQVDVANETMKGTSERGFKANNFTFECRPSETMSALDEYDEPESESGDFKTGENRGKSFLVPIEEQDILDLIKEENNEIELTGSNNDDSEMTPLNCLINYDPRFSKTRASVTKTYLYDGDDFGQKLLELLDEEIAHFPYGVELYKFFTEIERRKNQPIHVHKILNHNKLIDIFYIKNNFQCYVKPEGPALQHQTLLFPAWMKQFGFNVYLIQYKIWHLCKMLLIILRRRIKCTEAFELLKKHFGIDFDPKFWSLPDVTFFTDCIRKFPDGLHEIKSDMSGVYLTRREFEPIVPVKGVEIAPFKPDLIIKSDFASWIILPHLSNVIFSIDFQQGKLSFATDSIEEKSFVVCLPQIVYNYNYFTMAAKETWNLFNCMGEAMRKFYDGLDESNKIQGRLQVEPNLLKKGLMIAIHDPYTSEPSYKWQRGMVLSRITDTDFRVCAVDCGSILNVNITRIRYLFVDFLSVPIQGICCKSTYVKENNLDVWRGLTKDDVLLAIMRNQQFLVEFIRRDKKGVWEVEIHKILKEKDNKFQLKLDVLRNSLDRIRAESERTMYWTQAQVYADKAKKARIAAKKAASTASSDNVNVNMPKKQVDPEYEIELEDRRNHIRKMSPTYRFDYNKIKRRNGCFAVSSNIVRLQEAFAGTDFLNTEYKLEEIGTLEDGKEENLIQQFYKY